MSTFSHDKGSATEGKFVVTGKDGHAKATFPAHELTPAQLHLRKILVPVDFSKHSHKAVRYAKALASQFSARIQLLHVVESIEVPSEFGALPFDVDAVMAQRREQASARMRELADEHGISSLVDPPLAPVGNSWSDIIEAAKAQASDLIVIGTHGRSGLKHVLLGSVAERVVRHAPCPVLVVRAEEHDFL